MSKYHSGCSKQSGRGQGHGNKKESLISKPFCDCSDCSCRHCPDILQMLSITVTENSCDFGSKGKKRASKSSLHEAKRPSLLDVLNEDRDCDCEVVARAVRSHVHMNLDPKERRATATSNQRKDSQSSKDVATNK